MPAPRMPGAGLVVSCALHRARSGCAPLCPCAFGVSPSGKSNYRKDANENRPRAHGYSASRRPVVLQPRNRRPDPQSRCLCRAFLRVRQPLDRLGSLHACPPRHPHRSLQLPRAPLGPHRALRCDAAGLPARERQLLPHHHRPLPLPTHRWRGLPPGVQHLGLLPRPGGRPVGQPHR